MLVSNDGLNACAWITKVSGTSNPGHLMRRMGVRTLFGAHANLICDGGID